MRSYLALCACFAVALYFACPYIGLAGELQDIMALLLAMFFFPVVLLLSAMLR